MSRFTLAAATVLVSLLTAGDTARAADPPPNVQYPSDGAMLPGWIFKPETTKLGLPAVIWNHGSDATVHPSLELAKTYTDHGFVVFYPVRRYHRPATQGKTINDLVAAAADKKQAWIDYNEEENRDVFNALAWLKTQTFVNPDKIIVSGCSFGGVQTLLAAEKGGGFKVAIAFAPGAMSWGGGNTKINARLERAVKNRKIPLFILQANNDWSLGPTNVLGPLLDRVPLLHKVKQYPDFGTRTPEMTEEEWHQWGHGKFAMRGGDVWGADVFAFIQEGLTGSTSPLSWQDAPRWPSPRPSTTRPSS